MIQKVKWILQTDKANYNPTDRERYEIAHIASHSQMLCTNAQCTMHVHITIG